VAINKSTDAAVTAASRAAKRASGGKLRDNVVRIMSTLASRAELAVRAGLQFSDNRDLYAVFGYTKRVQYRDVLAKYARQDIAGRIVDAPADALWTNPPTVTSTAAGFDDAWEVLVRDLHVWSVLGRVDRLAGMHEYGLLFVGLSDGSDVQMPATASRRDNEVLFLQPISRVRGQIEAFNKNPKDARFNLPELYSISQEDPTNKANSVISESDSAMQQANATKVHWSRMLHVVEHPLEDTLFGYPRLLKVYNILDDLLKVGGGTAETYWLIANRGLHVDIDKEMDLDADDAAELGDEIDEYMHQLRRVIRTRGTKITPLGSESPKPRETFEMLLALISGATGIPQRILLGAEAGQLASEQDRANWAERVEERRINFAEPIVLRPFINLLQGARVLPEGEVEIEWPDSFNMSPLEESQTMAATARAAQNLSRSMDPTTGKPLLNVAESRGILGYPEDPEIGDPVEEQQIEEEEPFEFDSGSSGSDEDSGEENNTTTSGPSGRDDR